MVKKNIVKQEIDHPILGYFVLNSMFRDQLFWEPFFGGQRGRKDEIW